jgi:hypothetical protein
MYPSVCLICRYITRYIPTYIPLYVDICEGCSVISPIYWTERRNLISKNTKKSCSMRTQAVRTGCGCGVGRVRIDFHVSPSSVPSSQERFTEGYVLWAQFEIFRHSTPLQTNKRPQASNNMSWGLNLALRNLPGRTSFSHFKE